MDRSAWSDSGQAVPLFLALTVAVIATAAVALGVARAAIDLDRRQAIADVAALAGATALREGAGPEAAVTRAELVARDNGMSSIASTHTPTQTAGQEVHVRVVVSEPLHIGFGSLSIAVGARRSAEAMVASPIGLSADPGPGDYPGPFAWRQGQPMRPDVATAFDRLAAAASVAGVQIAIASAWRSSTEQARLFAAHPDPKWVARPGTSLHRLGTELDLGPAAAYGWLAVNSGRFGFLKRYPWEPWHFGYIRGPGSASVGFGGRASSGAGWASGGRGARSEIGRGISSGNGTAVRRRSGALQPWVPAKYAQAILSASMRHGVSAAVLAAQLRAESDFNPRSVSQAGAQGIAQLMPYEAARFHVNPFRPAEAIDAQARLMRELLGRFGSVPLALAAYNAGPNVVARCGCIPPYPETRAYVAKIIGWISGTGGVAGPPVVLVA